MATHGTLRTDLFDASSIWEEEVTVLVPGPGFPDNPRDYRTETIRYPNAETVRELFRKLDGLQKVHTLSPATSDDDTIYQAVIHKDAVLYSANPDDPANPSVIATASPLTFKTIVVSGQSDVVADAADDTLTLVAGTNITLTTDATTDTITIDAAGGGGSASNSFVNIAISGQTTVVADSTTDTLTLVAGTGISLTTDAPNDTITIAASGVTTAAFTTIAVSGQSNVVADSAADTLTLVAGSNVTITTSAAGDSITFAAADTNTTYTAGLYLDLTGTEFSVDFTEVASYSGASRQRLMNDSGTIQWESEASLSLQWGLASGAITAATGQAAASWGSGNVQFYDDSGVNDGSPLAVDNPFPAAFATGYTICCDRSKTPPRIVSGSCEGF